MEPVLALAVILVLGVSAQWLGWRLRLPSILFLLLFGFLVGPVTGWLDPDRAIGPVLLPFTTIAVAIILFEGGLNLELRELEEVGSTIRNLATAGVVVTWLVGGALAHFLFGLGWPGALLVGAVLSVSGPTVVGPLLETVRPTRRLANILKWESILIDPIGAALGIIVFDAIVASASSTVVPFVEFGTILLAGATAGLFFGRLLLTALERYWIPDSLHNPVALGFVFAAFGTAEALRSEAGLFGVTVMGFTLANQSRVNLSTLVKFSESLRTILIGALFVVLAARLPRADLFAYGPHRVLFIVNLVLIVRPLAVWLSTLKSGLSWQERTFLAAMAPRGIVAAATASVFGLKAAEAGYDGGDQLVSLVFVVIVATVLFYSIAAAPIARALGVTLPPRRGTLVVGANPVGIFFARALQDTGQLVLVTDTDAEHLEEATRQGLTAFPLILEEVDLEERTEAAGLSTMLVFSTAPEIASLTEHRMREWFGRAAIFRLTPQVEFQAEHQRLGRDLFASCATYAELHRMIERGASLEKITAWEGFAWEPFVAGQGKLPLWIVRGNGSLDFATADHPPMPAPGETVVFLDPSSGRARQAALGAEATG